MKKKRRVVQITDVQETIVALCDDGSIWLLAIQFDESFHERRWQRLHVPPDE